MPRIADEVKTVAENPGPWMLWIYGDYGAGKTILGAGFPNVLMMDTEGSRRSLLNHPELVNTKFLTVNTYSDFKKYCDEIILGKDALVQSIETIDIDTVSTLQMLELNDQMKIVGGKDHRNADLPSQAEFNINNTRIRKVLLDLKERSNKNIILISHIKEEQDDNGTTILIRPGNSPSLSSSIASLCDGIFYLQSKTDSKGETTRTLKCMPSTKIRAKNRFTATLEKEVVNPTAKDILKAIDEQRELARQYSEQENSNA
jgi:hypothetical protein